MPLIYQKVILRLDLRNNPEWLHVFGDNVARRGLGGQAREMRGEPNAIGIPTKWLPTNEDKAFFRDDRMNEILELIEPDYQKVVEALEKGVTVVWPKDGIGTGLAGLPWTAPKLWAELERVRKDVLEKL